MDFEPSGKVKLLQNRLQSFMQEHVYPNERRFRDEIECNRWAPTRVVEELKPKAQAAGLWNLFLPNGQQGTGLTNLEYAPLCEIMGRSVMAPEVFNCGPIPGTWKCSRGMERRIKKNDGLSRCLRERFDRASR